MSPALSRALNPLRFRPLMWMAIAAVGGVAAGAAWAEFLGAVSRADTRLLFPILPAFLSAIGAWQMRRNGMRWRFFLAATLFFAFTASAARRIVPPQGDISALTAVPVNLDGPLKPISLQVRGVVADYPRIGDFSTQFPLDCTAPRRGRIWVSAPYGTSVQVGDIVSLQVELSALPTPGNWGERASFWRFIGNRCWCLGRKAVVFETLGVEPSTFVARRIALWRQGILEHYERAFRGDGSEMALQMRPFPAANAQLMTAMVFGEGGLSRPLPQTLREDFRAAGLSHVLVASGTQVAFLTVILLWAARGLGLKRAPLLLVIVPILVLYALLAGGAASIWRATLGGVLLTWALLLGRDVDGLSLWSVAILILLVLDPLNAWSLSFQLTFAATWGLMVLAPAIARLFAARFGRGGIYQLAALSLGAQAATMPISLFHFGSFSAAGVGANFIAVPLAGLMVGTGLVGLIFSPFNLVNYYLTRGVASVAHAFALSPGARFDAPPPGLWWPIACYVLFFAALAPLSFDWKPLYLDWRQKLQPKMPRLRPWSLVPLFLGVSLWLLWLLRGPANPDLRVTMFDVGQGEAILIRAPSGQNVLIDGGSLEGRERSDIGAQVLVPALQSLGVERLDLLVLTHADADHCNGLAALAREIPIGAFLDGAGAGRQSIDPALVDYLELRKALAQAKVPILAPRAGQNFEMGEVKLRVLAPSAPLLEAENDNSIVLRLDFGQNSLLFTGDIESAGEERLLQRGAHLRCTVLKVAHHGSKTSTTPAFLQAADPQIALISCGRYNRFGHPHAQILRRLTDANVAVFRTDLGGALQLDCDRAACRVTPFR